MICFTWENINLRASKEVDILSSSSMWPLTISSTQAALFPLRPCPWSSAQITRVLAYIRTILGLFLETHWRPHHSMKRVWKKKSGFNVISVEYLVLKCSNFYITLTLAYHKFYARNHNTYKNTTSVLATLCQSLHSFTHTCMSFHKYIHTSSTWAILQHILCHFVHLKVDIWLLSQ